MKVMVLANPHEMRIEERPHPVLSAGEVILKVNASGICGSDLHGYLGHDKTRSPGMILGHEVSGVVIESASPHHPTGLLVTSNSAFTCWRCDYCIQGRDNLCEQRRSLGKHRQGAYAEYVAIPASGLVDVPQDMDPIRAALTEPIAVSLHAINLSLKSMVRPMPEARALVLGGGAIGFLGAMILKAYGCCELMLAETNPLRRRSASKHVGCDTYDPRETEVDANRYDFVLDAVGAQATMDAAFRAARRGGVISQVGLHDHDVKIDFQKLVRTQITLVGAANYPMMELRAAVKLLASDAFRDLSWVELRPLDDGPRAFDDLAKGKVSSPKIILQPAHAA